MLHLCPCTSGRLYSACCQPFLAGTAKPSTALELMRSRYCAYVLRNTEYILQTWHPATRPHTITPDTLPEWTALTIHHTEKGEPGDVEGTVTFTATALINGTTHRLHESSRFVQQEQQWLYVEGVDNSGDRSLPEAVPRKKTGRNAPCPCGSGKKFKQCCGR